MPERVTTTLIMPRRLTVAAGWPTAALPVSQTRMASARSRSAFFGTKSSRPPVPCSSDPSTTSFRLTGTSSPRARRASEVHHDVALAVGRAATVPTAVDLGELERRGSPRGLVEGRLDVVVRVQQDGRCGGVGAWSGSDDGLAPVGGFGKAYVGEAELGELVENPLGRCGALLRRELAGISHRPDGDELGELGSGLRHQAGNTLSQFHVPLAAGYRGRLELLDHLLESG